MVYRQGKMPSFKAVKKIIYLLKDYMFPLDKKTKNGAISRLSDKIQIKKIKSAILKQVCECLKLSKLDTEDFKILKQTAIGITCDFLNEIPVIKNLCLADAKTSVACDPSAEDEQIVIAAFPGFFAIMTYRIAHFFYEKSVPFLPRLMSEYAHSKTGIDINAGAKIGKNFFIDHGTGVVIGETSVIGDDCRIYQGVTIGALSVKKCDTDTNAKRHPTIGNNVTVYANATILGGKTEIGDNSVIGGNTFIIKSVPSNSKIVVQPTNIN